MNIFKRTRIRYILHRHAIEHGLWTEVTGKLAPFIFQFTV